MGLLKGVGGGLAIEVWAFDGCELEYSLTNKDGGKNALGPGTGRAGTAGPQLCLALEGAFASFSCPPFGWMIYLTIDGRGGSHV
ncbi:hypothetical protein GALMADRAFT_1140790 [Galerina marginata CBS 339.88]|uniref:Uncharacterized protein n=1 Tax=Galerina marginata (strain CBS 339.88) TaxID=685588 RepID=A0A067SA29_GALM3|nr:hypothetical protein GALMADRAFT_1140790 [Galerina marginata CBS 339.88]